MIPNRLLISEMVEIESYYEDVQKLKEELSDAENELKQERGRGKGREGCTCVCVLNRTYN